MADHPRDQHERDDRRGDQRADDHALAIGDEPGQRRFRVGRIGSIWLMALHGGGCSAIKLAAAERRRATFKPLWRLTRIGSLFNGFASSLACSGRRKSRSPTSSDDSHLRSRGRCNPVQRIARPVTGGLDQLGVDIGLAADRGRVAERFGDRLEHRLQADPRLFMLVRRQHLVERDDARAPGAEVLGGEIAARSLPGYSRSRRRR